MKGSKKLIKKCLEKQKIQNFISKPLEKYNQENICANVFQAFRRIPNKQQLSEQLKKNQQKINGCKQSNDKQKQQAANNITKDLKNQLLKQNFSPKQSNELEGNFALRKSKSDPKFYKSHLLIQEYEKQQKRKRIQVLQPKPPLSKEKTKSGIQCFKQENLHIKSIFLNNTKAKNDVKSQIRLHQIQQKYIQLQQKYKQLLISAKNQLLEYEQQKNHLLRLKSHHFMDQNELDSLRQVYLNFSRNSPFQIDNNQNKSQNQIKTQSKSIEIQTQLISNEKQLKNPFFNHQDNREQAYHTLQVDSKDTNQKQLQKKQWYQLYKHQKAELSIAKLAYNVEYSDQYADQVQMQDKQNLKQLKNKQERRNQLQLKLQKNRIDDLYKKKHKTQMSWFQIEKQQSIKEWKQKCKKGKIIEQKSSFLSDSKLYKKDLSSPQCQEYLKHSNRKKKSLFSSSSEKKHKEYQPSTEKHLIYSQVKDNRQNQKVSKTKAQSYTTQKIKPKNQEVGSNDYEKLKLSRKLSQKSMKSVRKKLFNQKKTQQYLDQFRKQIRKQLNNGKNTPQLKSSNIYKQQAKNENIELQTSNIQSQKRKYEDNYKKQANQVRSNDCDIKLEMGKQIKESFKEINIQQTPILKFYQQNKKSISPSLALSKYRFKPSIKIQ